ncbi:MAG: cyclase family protein, partial [Hyphomicrobiales bacterium]|nr:cyclase family protein [Hyphomicrobiales bacterium]
MRIVDLSLPINARMAALPGFKAYDENPTRLIPLSVISPAQVQDLKQRGLQFDGEPEATNHMLSKLEITTHIGTHIDAPLHMLENSWSIDEVPLERLVKKGRVIPLADTPYGGVVTAEAILATGVSFDDSV